LTLREGESWPPASISNVPQTAESAAVGLPPGQTALPLVLAPRSTDPAPPLHGKTSGNPAPSANLALTKPAASGDAPVSSAAEDFARAMAVFSRGDYGTAEPLLSAFEARYPHSAHNEDVLFLRALARGRRGDQVGARALAEEYVRLYPKGFRAEEARKMAREN
jgi:TolA-binding protein